MGRGLSALQRDILCLAYTNHVAEGRPLPTYRVLALGPAFLEPDEPRPVPPAGDPKQLPREERLRIAEAIQGWLELGHARADEALAGRCAGLMPDDVQRVRGPRREPPCTALRTGPFATRDEADALVARLTAHGIDAETDGDYAEGTDLYFHEVLIGCFGFGAHRRRDVSGRLVGVRIPDGPWEGANRRLAWGKFFSKSSVGAARYNAATVATSKALARLQARGLVDRLYGGRVWQGVDLTPSGFALAEQLSAKRVAGGATLSHYGEGEAAG